MSDQLPPLETDPRFPSGDWLGFYVQPTDNGNRHKMDLVLNFRGGRFTGDGRDTVGEFVIRGRYNLESGEVTFHKAYRKQHEVYYRGFNEGKGIWGNWEILGAKLRGGFHIWPKGMPDPTASRLEAREKIPRAAEKKVLVEQLDPT